MGFGLFSVDSEKLRGLSCGCFQFLKREKTSETQAAERGQVRTMKRVSLSRISPSKYHSLCMYNIRSKLV